MKALFALTSFFLVGCAYSTNLRGFDFGATPPATLKDKTIAVVIEKGRIQDGHTTRTDAYDYTFNNVTSGVTEALQKRISMSAKKVDIVQAEDLKPNSYEFLVYPSVEARSVHDFWTMGCLINYRLEVKRGSDGKLIANESGEGKRNFMSAGQFDKKCNEAMSEVFIKVTDRTLNLVR